MDVINNLRIRQKVGDKYNVLLPETSLQQVQDLTTGKRLSEIIGTLDNLNTFEKESIVKAINETLIEVENVSNKVGNLDELNTIIKSNTVVAINEIINRLENLGESDYSKVTKGEFAINVKDYGAKGDGVTVDTQAFKDAIAVAKTKGKMLYIPTGVYWTDSLTIPSGMTIQGDGITKTILKLVANSTDALLVITEQNDVTLRGFTVDGNSQNHVAGSTIIFWKSRRNMVDNIKVVNSATIGLNMSNVTDSRIQNSHFDGTTENCVVSFSNDNQEYSIGNNTVVNNIMENGALDGIIYNTIGGIITDNVFLNNGKRQGWTAGGVYANNKYYLTIANNLIIGNNGNGVDLIDCGNSIVTGNSCRDNNSAGIMFANCKNSNIENNVCVNNGVQPAVDQDDGITILGGSQLIISGNRCFDGKTVRTQTHGIHLLDNANNIIIANNLCTDNKENDGIKLESTTSDILRSANKPMPSDLPSEMNILFNLTEGQSKTLIGNKRISIIELVDKSLRAYAKIFVRGTDNTFTVLESPVSGMETENTFSFVGDNFTITNNRAGTAYYSYRITYVD